jgi:hypothetical protein
MNTLPENLLSPGRDKFLLGIRIADRRLLSSVKNLSVDPKPTLSPLLEEHEGIQGCKETRRFPIPRIYRCLLSDCVVACESIVSGQSHTDALGGETVEGKKLPRLEWIHVLYRVADADACKEELIKCLPHNIQWDMFRGCEFGNFVGCGELLKFTVNYGNLNVVDSSEKNILRISFGEDDMIHVGFRFFISFSGRLGSWNERKDLLNRLNSCRFKLYTTGRIDRCTNDVVLIEICLAALSACVSSDVDSVEWVRELFVEVLTTDMSLGPQTSGDIKTIRLGGVYWVCLLWASVCKRTDRAKEAIAVLENTFDDIQAFCRRHPECATVRRLQAIACHNLCVEHLKSGNVIAAIKWAHCILEIGLTSQVILPAECTNVVRWAESVQTYLERPYALI